MRKCLKFLDGDEEIGIGISGFVEKNSARFIATKGVSQYLSISTRRRWDKGINHNTFHLHSINSLNGNGLLLTSYSHLVMVCLDFWSKPVTTTYLQRSS